MNDGERSPSPKEIDMLELVISARSLRLFGDPQNRAILDHVMATVVTKEGVPHARIVDHNTGKRLATAAVEYGMEGSLFDDKNPGIREFKRPTPGVSNPGPYRR